MFSKIVIRNVGVLKAFDTPNAPKLAQLSLFYGRNGRGKSTLTAVMRAARDGCSSTVLARTSLGNGGAPPEVTLVGDSGTVLFRNGRWDRKDAPVEVFDTAFIADNIYAGELIELAHDRGLFSVIIGKEGVKLATHLDRFNVIARQTGADLKAAEAALVEDKPADIKLDEFFALGPNPDYAKRLEDAELALKSVQQADKIAALKAPEEVTAPTLPSDTASVLASTVADVDASARDRLLEHFKRFELDKKGEEWINYGLDHIHDDACAFCGREGVDAEGMVTLYGQIFGETYKGHVTTIKELAAEVETALGEDARSALAAKIEANAEAVRKWSEYVRLEQELPDMTAFAPLVVEAHKAAKASCDKKRASPLDKIEATDELAGIAAKLTEAGELLKGYNAAVAAINAATAKASAIAPTTVDAATTARDNVKKRIARHDVGVQNRVKAYFRAKNRDERAKKMRTAIQKALKSANEAAAEHYHQRVNYYLGRFGASFRISKITNSMQGNAGQSDYGLIIKGETIARHRGRQADAVTSFRNTLSAGDKTTLALAFFLAKLDQDSELCDKTLVVDDPLSSHDSHRRRETVRAIKELCGRCRQVIVLSHDEFLLREIERRCSGVTTAAFQIDYNGGDEWSVASAVDLDLLCRAGHAKLVDEIAAYVDRREGVADDVVLKIRQVLETHYRRSYSGWFDHDQNLGSMVRSISETGQSHPCHRDLTKLDNCNDATCDKHHGDNAIVVVKRGVDPDELKVIATDALELIGARRPSIVAAHVPTTENTPPVTPANANQPVDPAGVS
jgi:wobble nucleotide-excising tRNase